MDLNTIIKILGSIIIISFTLFLFYIKHNKKQKKVDQVQQEKAVNEDKKSKPISQKQLKKEILQQQKQQLIKQNLKNFKQHQSYYSSLKGFSNQISCFSIDNDFIVVASQDKTFKIYNLKQLEKQTELQYYSGVLDYNYASCINLNIQQKLIACGLSNDHTVELFCIKKKQQDNKPFMKFLQQKKFANHLFSSELLGCDLICNASAILVSLKGNDTNVFITNLEGEIINKFNTNQIQNYYKHITYQKNFFCIGSWQGDIQVYQIQQTKESNTFKSISKVMNLSGHVKGVMYLASTEDQSTILTISFDKTIKIWNINVKFEEKQDAKLLVTFLFEEINQNNIIQSAALQKKDQNLLYIAFAFEDNILIYEYNQRQNKIENQLKKILTIKIAAGGTIRQLEFFNQKYLLTMAEHDKRINIFKIFN